MKTATRSPSAWRYEFYATYDPPRQIDRLNPLIAGWAASGGRARH